MDCLDLCSPRDFENLLQHHSSKESILQCSAFFIAQFSHPYMTTGKTTALTRWTFVGKVMSLLFNMLSRLVRAFLSRRKCLLISWLQSPTAVILEPKNKKSATVSTVFGNQYLEPVCCSMSSSNCCFLTYQFDFKGPIYQFFSKNQVRFHWFFSIVFLFSISLFSALTFIIPSVCLDLNCSSFSSFYL